MDFLNRKLLQEIIEKRKLTQMELARMSKLSRNTIGNMIHGKCKPSLEVIYEMIIALNLTEKETLEVFFPGHKFPPVKN